MIVANSSINAAHAFLLLSNNNITAIPIVDAKGKMVNVLSTSDIALLTFVDLHDEKSEEQSKQLKLNRRASEAAVKIKLAFDALNTMGTLSIFVMDLLPSSGIFLFVVFPATLYIFSNNYYHFIIFW